MQIHLTSTQNMFGMQTQKPMQRTIGQVQNSGLENIIQQINANYGIKRNRDTVELSKKALELLNASDAQKTDENKKPEEASGYQKYAAEMFSKEEWAENSILEQRDGIQTVSDIIDYAKSKLQYTMSKISELENYLNGTGTHSNTNMTKELAETYLHNYKQSIQSDYTDIIQSHINSHKSTVDEYDELSGGLASKVIGNQLNSISAESLGLSNLSGNAQEIMEALENASNILDGMKQNIEDAYKEMTGGKQFAEPARSTSIFSGKSSFDFFASQMEKSHNIIDTTQMKFTGETLNFL
ncbi:hypothetical protein [Clostridium sp. MD294]|uniref:hypothetical protein n=1 Tax=Clostridium sp. MD294 TaxID=97138 RepID=UPI0002CBD13F|nr:hypothetical protein [Clostridium sp. MD294]NDO45364.1 hypothetical protein [Clostridium sp. MD294]USF30995.1 hypothetical protein C820_002441 [Clostridium sp. MD294]